MKNKMLKSKNNLIISIVALLECVLLLAITTYSWIESASSLRIATSQPVTIAESLNYEYVINTNSNKAVDLSTYFNDTAYFSFAQASSADGKSLFFSRTDANGNTVYRAGNTTDYNNCFYNFDFLVNNTGDSDSVLYFFNSEDIFAFVDDDINLSDGTAVTSEQMDSFLGAFRIAITSGTATSIYSKSSATYLAASSTTETRELTTKKYSSHLYNINDDDTTKQSKKIFQCAGNSTANINIKIWFECNDTNFVNLKDDVKSALLGADVKINLVFNNSSSSFKTFTFNDYTLSTDNTDSANSMYFYDGEKTYPMVQVVSEDAEESSSDYITWATCDEDDSISSTISDDIVKTIYSDDNGCYFYYGTVDSNGAPDAVYTWNVPSVTTDYNSFTYNALSITPTSANTFTGVGFWDNTEIKAVEFEDKATYYSDNDYNAGGYKFITQNRLYTGKSGDTTSTPIKMCYDEQTKLFRAYVPVEYLQGQLAFYYTSADYYNSNVIVTWTAAANNDEGTPKYTAVGYNAKGKLSAFTASQAGVGTWGKTQRINLSTELVDSTALITPDYRYRVTFLPSGSTTYVYIYMTTDPSDPLTMYAEVPVDANLYGFYYLKADGGSAAYWTGVGSGNGSDTYYPTSMNLKSTGVWNLAVLVDGTADNLIGYTTNTDNLTGGSLEYSTDGTTYNTMTQIDDYRWVTDALADSITTVYFRWTAYTANDNLGYVDTVFDYTYELGESSSGIHYYVVTESGSNVSAN